MRDVSRLPLYATQILCLGAILQWMELLESAVALVIQYRGF